MMNRNVSVVAVVLLLSTSSGCSGMRNFLFGRGAQCGLCNQATAPPAFLPNGLAPYAPPVASADCGCNGNVASDVCTGDATCGSYGAAYGPGVEYSNSYGPVVSDPYSEQVIGGGVMYGQGAMGPGTIIDGGYVPGSMPDDFEARRYDTQGDRIIRQDPLPPGAQLLQ